MIQREMLQSLAEWRRRSDRKPLVLRGARQVGKTTVVAEFGRTFDQFLPLNLERRRDAALFDQVDDARELLDEVHIHLGLPKRQGSTLLFIDEIQQSPRAIAMLRYLYEDLPGLHVIAAGSLLENLVDVQASFPVGRVEYMAMRPCSFMEFLDGVGAASDAQVIKDLAVKTIHERLMHRFRQYVLVGGMPAVVSQFAQAGDLLALDHLYDSLLTSYRDDAGKYAHNETQRQLLAHILQSGWAEAAETVTLAGFAGSNYKSREVGEAMRTLERAMLLELVYPVVEPRVPLLAHISRRPKLIWLDTGLVNYQAGIRSGLLATPNVMDMWRGRVAEQVVAQEVLSLDHRVTGRRQFWARDRREGAAEVDFVVQHGVMAVPVEVKAGHNSRLRSLHSYMDVSPCSVAVRVWDRPLTIDHLTTPSGKAFTLINLPFYYLSQLHTLIERYSPPGGVKNEK